MSRKFSTYGPLDSDICDPAVRTSRKGCPCVQGRAPQAKRGSQESLPETWPCLDWKERDCTRAITGKFQILSSQRLFRLNLSRAE